MSRPLIVLGDKTSHGGTVISADLTVDIHGKYIARVGDMTVCPNAKGLSRLRQGLAIWSTVAAMDMHGIWTRLLVVRN